MNSPKIRINSRGDKGQKRGRGEAARKVKGERASERECVRVREGYVIRGLGITEEERDSWQTEGGAREGVQRRPKGGTSGNGRMEATRHTVHVLTM